MLPIAYGTVRMAGNIIWATPIRQQKNVQTTRTGKGGVRQKTTTTTYTYYATFALALAEGPAANVLRIWADTQLVYDASTGSDTIRRPGFRFRFYPGNETQLPDSLIEADKGTGNVSAYRGTCYLVFDDIPLESYGNRIPNINVELAFDTAASHTSVE